MQNRWFVLLALIIILVFASCATKAGFDIRCEWEYTLTDLDGNVYDTGTIIFSGEPAEGIYHQINIYQVEYEGRFTVNGSTLELTGYEMWKGTMANANTIEGTWTHDDGTAGTFSAFRR